jgi:hypothetical protein
MLEVSRLQEGRVDPAIAPFPLVIAEGLLPDAKRPALHDDFPDYASAGFFPYAETDCGPSIRTLVAELTAPAFADALGGVLGIDQLRQYPTLVTLAKSFNRRHGTIHTDSSSKVASALLYLNPQWPDTSDGCLRFLRRIDDIDAVIVPEIRPMYGALAAFKRTDHSFHGHLPYEGERRVIQVAWLTSNEEKDRKIRSGRLSRWVKRLVGGLDRRFGAGRGRSDSHPR